MTDLIKAMNPRAPLLTEGDALAAARVSAIGMVLGAISNVAEAWYTQNGGAEATQRAVENLTGQVQTAEQVSQSAQFGMIGVAVIIVLQLILAVVQWRKPTSWLPILFLVLVIWGIGTTLLGLAMGGAMASMGMPARPMWLTIITLVTLIPAAIMHIASIRGAGQLDRIRMEAAGG